MKLFIFFRRAPFANSANDTAGDILSRIGEARFDLQGGPWRNISEEAKDLVHKMLDMDPNRRPTAGQVNMIKL